MKITFHYFPFVNPQGSNYDVIECSLYEVRHQMVVVRNDDWEEPKVRYYPLYQVKSWWVEGEPAPAEAMPPMAERTPPRYAQHTDSPLMGTRDDLPEGAPLVEDPFLKVEPGHPISQPDIEKETR